LAALWSQLWVIISALVLSIWEIRLAHAVECFVLFGDGKADGDKAGLPPAQLAVLPATTHVGWVPPYRGIITRTQLLLPILTEFLDSPLSEAS
jgi:hypothetical protein